MDQGWYFWYLFHPVIDTLSLFPARLAFNTQAHESLIQAPAKLMRRTSEMLRLLADLQLLRDEGERGLSHFTPSVVNNQ